MNPTNKNEKVIIKARNRLMSKSTSTKDRVMGAIVCGFLLTYTLVIFLGETLLLPNDEKQWCEAARKGYPGMDEQYENPDYPSNPCLRERSIWLLFINLDECYMARHMLYGVIFGAAIGFERNINERAVGIRTMSLVCLGACFFTISSNSGFRSSSMPWDAARVAAMIPKGVGFLGAALIWKGTKGTKGSPDERHEVHGLTTAAGVWLSAAIGVGTGGNLLILSAYAVALVIIVLRLGPLLDLGQSTILGTDFSSTMDMNSDGNGNDSDSHYDTNNNTKDSHDGNSNDSNDPVDPVIPKHTHTKPTIHFSNEQFEGRTIHLKPRDKKIRSLSPRTFMRAQSRMRPTFHS